MRVARVPFRRWRLSLTTLGAAALVAAVAVSSSSAKPTAAKQQRVKQVKLAFVYAGTFANFAQEMALGAQAAAGHSPGVKFTQSAPGGNDGNQEVQLFQAATHTSQDGIAMETLFPQLFIRPLQQASSAGIPLIAVDTPPAPGTNVQTFVGNSNTELGQALANELLKQKSFDCKGGGEILEGTDTPGLPVLELRNAGFKAVIKKACPSVKVIDFDSKQTATDNYNSWSAAVKAHPNALAYVGPGSQDATSLAQIQRQTHKRFLAGADDLDPVALQGVKQGLVFALVSPEHWLKGYIAMKLLIAHAQQGKPLPKGWWNPGFLVVDKSNIAKILARQKSAATQYAWFKNEAAAQLAHPSKYIKPLKDAN